MGKILGVILPPLFLLVYLFILVSPFGVSGHIEPIEQFLMGFINEPGGHLKSFANSSESINDPISRYGSGVCTPDNAFSRLDCGYL